MWDVCVGPACEDIYLIVVDTFVFFEWDNACKAVFFTSSLAYWGGDCYEWILSLLGGTLHTG